MHETKSAVGYVRCSTDQQEDSPEQQKKAIQEFALLKGYEITDWFVDFGRSGTTFDQRPEFQRLRAAVENQPSFGAVICYDESRWGRAIDSEENTYWRFHFRMRGVEVLLVKTSIDPGHEFAPMLKAFEGVQASQYSKKLSEVTFRGQANNGIYSSGGTAPYGYRRVAVNSKTGETRDLGDGQWCIRKQEKVRWELGDAKEVETVETMFEERGSGASYSLIVRHLNQNGIACPRRGRWRNRDGKWSRITVKCIIENPVYCGARVYNRFSSSKLRAHLLGRDRKADANFPVWSNDKDDWVITENAHPAIVTKEAWQKANVHAGRQAAKPRMKIRYDSQYLLVGLMRCSDCGFGFQGWTGKFGRKWYPRYIDSGWKNKRQCEYLALDKDALESFALQAVIDTLSDPDVLNRVNEFLRQLFDAEPGQQQAELQRLESDHKKIEKRKRNLLTAIEQASGEEPVRSLTYRLMRLAREEEGLLLKIDMAKSEMHKEEKTTEVISAVQTYIAEFATNFNRADVFEQKTLLKRAISEIVVDRADRQVRFYIRKVPAATPGLAEILSRIESEEDVTSLVSARRRTRER
jgi:site-specific DNA recombinase